jgi:hypothetical protein
MVEGEHRIIYSPAGAVGLIASMEYCILIMLHFFMDR